MSDILLGVTDLSIEYRTREGPIYAVSGASLAIESGKITALVGESGSGKTSIAHSILQLLPNNGRVTSGEVIFRGRNLLTLKGADLREVRGRRVAMIFQNAVAGLNPVLRIGDQVAEVLTNHLGIHKKEAKQGAVRSYPWSGMKGRLYRDPRLADILVFWGRQIRRCWRL